MTNLTDRIRAKIADANDWHGSVMSQWDIMRSMITEGDKSDMPRLMFESEIEGFVELLEEALAALQVKA